MRICPPVRGQSSNAAAAHNIELRLPDGLCNPYLLIGALAAAGLDGIRQGLKIAAAANERPRDIQRRSARRIRDNGTARFWNRHLRRCARMHCLPRHFRPQ